MKITMNKGGTTNKKPKLKRAVGKPLSPAMKNRNKVKTKTEAEKRLERLKARNKRNKSITTFKKRKPAKKLAR
jgi:hypothetical protein